MNNQIILIIVIVIGISIFLLLSNKAKKVLNGDLTNTWFFKADDYQDKQGFIFIYPRNLRLLSIYLFNCLFVFYLCTLMNNLTYYLFAGLFFITTIVLWYTNTYKLLERYRVKNNDKDEN